VNPKAKERLVGSLILLCLAIIFIPPFYDGRNPFDLDGASLNQNTPIAPNFPESEDMANNIADVGGGRLHEIEESVKEANPEASRSDSSLPEKPEDGILESLGAKEMTSKLLSDIAESSPLASRFSRQSKLKQAWAVQVGSFKEAERAQKVRDHLVKNGFQAYIKTVVKDGETISRVFAGVSLDKSVVEGIEKDLESRFGEYSAIVVPYQP
jgi:DedD protein